MFMIQLGVLKWRKHLVEVVASQREVVLGQFELGDLEVQSASQVKH